MNYQELKGLAEKLAETPLTFLNRYDELSDYQFSIQFCASLLVERLKGLDKLCLSAILKNNSFELKQKGKQFIEDLKIYCNVFTINSITNILNDYKYKYVVKSV